MELAFIGFGEAGGAIAEGLGPRPGLRGFDRKTDDPATADAKLADFARRGVAGMTTRAAALEGAEAVMCLVTADQAVTAARECAALLPEGALWFDMNSCSPGAKREAAGLVEASGGRYVDVAVMAPVYPKRHRVPLLAAGPHAEAAVTALTALGMDARAAGPGVGDASAIKMLRSVMVKGIEALTAECMLAAVRAGVDRAVLASLQASHPGTDWLAAAAYNLERMQVHGVRRAAEMREVVRTVEELGLPARMAAATVEWQQAVGELGLRHGDDEGHAARAAAILSRLR